MTEEFYVTLIYLKPDGTDDHSTNKYDTKKDMEKAYHQAMVTGLGKEDIYKSNSHGFWYKR